MAVMEGPLSKWTNVVKGWQYRWFVLDDNAGLLSYFTSKDKMKRGSRRGCVRLKGAIIGIDDEDDSTFTITVDHKTFHFQARDADEREKWIETLENTIVHHSRALARRGDHGMVPSAEEFEHKLAETDAYLQILIDQVKELEIRIDACEDLASKEKYNVIKVTANAMIEAIKHSIVMLQISKETLKEPLLNGSMHEAVLTQEADFDHYASPEAAEGRVSAAHSQPKITGPSLNGDASAMAEDISPTGESSVETLDEATGPALDSPTTVPSTSYSSSEDEDFFDAEEDQRSSRASPAKKVKAPANQTDSELPSPTDPTTAPSIDSPTKKSSVSQALAQQENDFYDELYDEPDDEGLGSLEKHGSIITHLLSQVRIGMDLTKVVLPTFILERRSLLEMYADFFAHPEMFTKIPEMESPSERMVQVVRWYMSSFHAVWNADIAKKPYNPILGETFCCYWNVPGFPRPSQQEKVDDGPVPWTTRDNISFISEQVSHHPPISAFYAEHYNKRISLDGYVWTKSKFLGLSIGVHMIGQAVVSVLDKDEEYVITFPNGYGRSILTVPWVELGGKVTIGCAKTGYSAEVNFLTKPFYGGKKHRVSGGVFAPNEKKPFCSLEGEWNDVIWAKFDSGMNEAFVNAKKLVVVKKQVKPTDQQGEFESRRLWREVTINLKQKNVEKATDFKHGLEQRQREEARERKEKGLKVETKHFHEVGEHWVYDRPLVKRLGKASNTPPSTL